MKQRFSKGLCLAMAILAGIWFQQTGQLLIQDAFFCAKEICQSNSMPKWLQIICSFWFGAGVYLTGEMLLDKASTKRSEVETI